MRGAVVPSPIKRLPTFHAGKVPFGYWRSFENRRKFFEWASDVLGIKSLNDWYHIKREQVFEIGGESLIVHYYNSSLSNALLSVFHEFSWQPWLFGKVPRRYWNEDKNVIRYLKWLSDQLSITNLSDWGLVTREELLKYGGASLISKFGSVANLLSRYYPDIDWTTKLQSHPNMGSKSQLVLYKMLQKLFPSQQVVMNYKDSKFTFGHTKRPMEFDIYLPESSLAVEYHGEQHYGKHYLYGDHEGMKHRDELKREACTSRGITLIEIPFWWDRNKSSLIATIKDARPDLLKDIPVQARPISPDMPSKYATKFTKSNDTFQSIFEYVPEFPRDADPTGWAVSPKWSGVHCLWNRHDLCTRKGTKILLPPAIKESLPSFNVDFVLHSSKKGVDVGEQLNKWHYDTALIDLWDEYQLKLVAVDAPSATLDYTSRTSMLKQAASTYKYLKSVQPEHCKGKDHLTQLINEATKQGCDGVILRKASSYYYELSSLYVAKKEPSEKGLVCDISKDTVTCKLFNQKTCTVTLPAKFQGSIHVGSVVTISHKGTTQDGSLQSPTLASIRDDISWDSLVSGRVGFRLAPSKGSGLCRACRQKLNQRGPLKVVVRGIFTPTYATPHPAKYGICLNETCLTTASKMYSDGTDAVCIPKFHGKILLPSSLKASLQQVQKDSGGLKGLDFIPVT